MQSRFLSPNGVETSEELSNVMEGMCNITGYISILKTINNTEASSLQGLLEQLLLEGCRLVSIYIYILIYSAYILAVYIHVYMQVTCSAVQ